MKRIAAVLAALLLIPAVSVKAYGPPELSAASAILMDAESGRVLFEKNAREERAIASITKLMTALVAVECGHDLTEQVTVRPEWTGMEGSSIYLRPGETVTLETLLYGLLLSSGNDAAIAVASCCAGDVESFVKQMNLRAKSLGMEHTHFVNPNGLSEEGHYSTAYDMALLARACCQNNIVAEIVETKTISLGTRTFVNHNKLLWRYEGCFGMKTGYTEAAGRTLVSCARKNGQTLIAVTLNAPDDWNDHVSLYDYGFEGYPVQTLCTDGQAICTVPVQGSLVPFVPALSKETVIYPLANGEQPQQTITLDYPVDSPIKAGERLGRLSFYLDEKLIGETDLIAGQAVCRNVCKTKPLWARLIGKQ